ncbi:hypothetical protein RCO28_14330 [Streptomyces sp. LHD-70]|uniref:hypothetical protein n=1 Tax=Streptomyces sp. LHD-70 TaxID=3072140 RepID=UPI00280CC580|nr:hypothetical protein [Streptomyces sp. LHD-70]MDQ8703657.1 hypothetical protein [Streptomyces sp. LHD-70]
MSEATRREPEGDEPADSGSPEGGSGVGSRGGSRGGSSGGSGGVSIGELSGGAVAAGHGATAEDRAERVAEPVPEDRGAGAAPAVPSPTAGGISIGAMSGGAVASGPRARAVDASTRTAAGPDPVAVPDELRAAIAELRAQLRVLLPAGEADRPELPQRPGDLSEEGLAELDAGLAEAEDEIDATGQVRQDRLQRLRERLELGATAAAGLASTAALAQQIAQLLGG